MKRRDRTMPWARERTGGFGVGKIPGQARRSATWGFPDGGVGGAVVRGVAVAGAQAVSGMASSTKKKDEVRLEYRLTRLDGTRPALESDDKRKATMDGEDLMTPLVQKAAEAIATPVTR